MAVGRHADMKLPAADLLVVEAQAAGQPRQLRLIGRLLQEDENEEGEQCRRKAEADDPADERDSLEQHDEHRRGDRVDGQLLPLRVGRRHHGRLFDFRCVITDRKRCAMLNPAFGAAEEPIQARNFRHFRRLPAFLTSISE